MLSLKLFYVVWEFKNVSSLITKIFSLGITILLLNVRGYLVFSPAMMTLILNLTWKLLLVLK